MAANAEIPHEPDERHFQIAQAAADRLAAQLDGNGLKAEQVRLGRHEDLVHELPGLMDVMLKPELATNQLKGKAPRGETLRNKEEVFTRAQGDVKTLVKDANVQAELNAELDRDAGQGFGKPDYKQALGAAKNEFCTVEQCPHCKGETTLPCKLCSASGNMPCQLCAASGMMQCPQCLGTGRQMGHDGAQNQCPRCFGRFQIQCTECLGARELRCTACAGSGNINCAECGRSGHWTHLYQATYSGVGHFTLNRELIPKEILEIVDEIGVRAIAVDGHAEIFRMLAEPKDESVCFAYIARLPTARVEFSVAGKTVPATVAGLHAKLMEIEPILDKIIKPGINALFKLSKGPMASEALIDTACKYKIIRQALGGLMDGSKRAVYVRITKEYPAILSEKYAKALVKYAEVALHAVAALPRKRGLAIGTVASALLYAAYFMSPARALLLHAALQADKAKFMPAVDGFIWLLGLIAAYFSIRIMAGRALKAILPDTVQGTKGKALPPAGPLAYWAPPLTLLAFVAVAFFAPDKASWVAHILSRLHK